MAYEYARRGARLALAARREERLKAVATKAVGLGSPDAIVICADVSEVEDCKRLVNETMDHFGQCMSTKMKGEKNRAFFFYHVVCVGYLTIFFIWIWE